MTTVSVNLEIGGQTVHAGTLFTHRRQAAESATLSYADAYLRLPAAYALEPSLPLASAPYQTDEHSKIFRAFGDCAPDRWGRMLQVRHEAALASAEHRQPRSLGEIDYLLGVRDDLRQGALRFRLDGGSEPGPFLATENEGVPLLTDLPTLLDLAERAEKDTANLSDLERLFRAGGSLGGARPKAHVLNQSGRLAIAKFPSAVNDTWNVMAWEKVAFDLARASGIRVPDSQLLRLAGRCVHLVDRFDRTTEGDRIGYVSALTMLEASDGDERSYLEIAEVIENVSDQASVDLKELWRRILFSVFISNTDDHLRNHGFLHQHHDVWRLSPAFDLNPERDEGYLSTTIDGSRSDRSVDLVMSVAEYFRLKNEESSKILNEVVAGVSRWRTVAQNNGLNGEEIERMETAFATLGQVA